MISYPPDECPARRIARLSRKMKAPADAWLGAAGRALILPSVRLGFRPIIRPKPGREGSAAMTEAVIVSTARTPIGRAFRGAYNMTHGATLAGHVIQQAVERARLDPAEVEDVIIGCGLPEGATGQNVGRVAALRAGLPVTSSGETVNRFCSSGLMAISIAAQRVIVDRVPVAVAGGVESISLVQNNLNKHHIHDENWINEHKPEVWMSMLETAEIVARRYQVTREKQDEDALASQQRTAAAQKAGRFDAEMEPLKTTKLVTDKETGKSWTEEVTLAKDEGNRPETTLADLARLNPLTAT